MIYNIKQDIFYISIFIFLFLFFNFLYAFSFILYILIFSISYTLPLYCTCLGFSLWMLYFSLSEVTTYRTNEPICMRVSLSICVISFPYERQLTTEATNQYDLESLFMCYFISLSQVTSHRTNEAICCTCTCIVLHYFSPLSLSEATNYRSNEPI